MGCHDRRRRRQRRACMVRPVTAVCFSPDGSRIATASGSAAPFLWEAKTGRAIGEPAGHDGRVLGRRVRSGRHDGWRWRATMAWCGFAETATGTLLGETLRHEAAVTALAFSPDGRRLVTGCLDGRARLWDTDSLDDSGGVSLSG